MTCENAILLMSARLDGQNTAEEEALLSAHLDRCEDCRRLMAAYTEIETNTAALEAPVPEGLKRGVMYRIDKEANPRKYKKRFPYAGTLVGAAAAVLVLLVGVGVIPMPQLSAAKNADAAPGKTVQTVSTHATDRTELIADNNGPKESSPAEPEPAAVPAWSADGLKHTLAGLITDKIIRHNQRGEADRPERFGTTDLDEQTMERCVRLSAENSAPVLVYTEFGCETLLELLKTEEPTLYEKFSELKPEVQKDGTVILKTSYGSLVAIHEWILEHLPEAAEDPEGTLKAAQDALLEKMQELAPDGLMTTVITWATRKVPVAWPKNWPEDWADRLRGHLNWDLIFPSETYTPAEDDPAFLVLLPTHAA